MWAETKAELHRGGWPPPFLLKGSDSQAVNHFSLYPFPFQLFSVSAVLRRAWALARGVRGVRQGIKEVSMVK